MKNYLERNIEIKVDIKNGFNRVQQIFLTGIKYEHQKSFQC